MVVIEEANYSIVCLATGRITMLCRSYAENRTWGAWGAEVEAAFAPALV